MEEQTLTIENINGRQKAAILIIAIRTEAASQIFKNLKDKDVERLAVEITAKKDIPSTIMEAVIEEFYQMIMAQEYITQGGMDYAKGVLEKAVGPRKAHEVISKVEAAIHVSGFSLLKDVDKNQLMNIIQHEHPQTIALILANLEAKQVTPIIAVCLLNFRQMSLTEWLQWERFLPNCSMTLKAFLKLKLKLFLDRTSVRLVVQKLL